MRKCKDIPDLPILRFIESHKGEWCFLFNIDISERSVLRAMPEGTPIRLAWAKMRTLHRRGLVDGCPCGCRGDFTLTEKGKAWLVEQDARALPLPVRDGDRVSVNNQPFRARVS